MLRLYVTDWLGLWPKHESCELWRRIIHDRCCQVFMWSQKCSEKTTVFC